jgi:pyruvate/2-oxoglutarate dehydrogenase complex dihydrolipoamide acyltransferase (E2) component
VLCRAQVEAKSIPDIARELAHLQQLAAAGKLSSLDLTGGSITISNIGGCLLQHIAVPAKRVYGMTPFGRQVLPL